MQSDTLQSPRQMTIFVPMPTDLQITVAFTGHRTYAGQADERLRTLVGTLYARGFRRFLSGMAVGFDLAAAEAVLACRDACPGLRLVAVVPFEGQQAQFSCADRERYARVRAAADEVVVLASAYHRGCYAVRNDYLVDRAGVVVAWYDGSSGGTAYTVRRAERKGRRLIHLHPSVQLVTTQPELF